MDPIQEIGKIDPTKWLALIRAILELFQKKPAAEMAMAFRCEEDHAASMRLAACHNLEAAKLCLECCQDQA